MSLILDGTTGVPVTTVTGTLPEANGGTGTTVGHNGFKNRIINGGMVIDQRNAGASVTSSAGNNVFCVDRFFNQSSSPAIYTMQQVSDAPSGFINSVVITVTTPDTSLVAGDFNTFKHIIEGLNVADFGWGTASAQPITFSFWVKSSLTGTFTCSIRNSAVNRSYIATYTISAANTWEQKTVTIAGDTSGTWLTTNGIGIRLDWSLGSGSDFQGTAGSWTATNDITTSGATSVVGTNGATFYITGVQLEKGSTATSFDYRPYGTELALCQRYFLKTNPDNASRCGGMWGSMLSTTTGHPTGSLPVAMRTAPTVVRGGTNDTFWVSGISATSAGTFSNFSSTTITIDSEVTGMSTSAIGYPVQYNGQLSLSSEL